MQNENDQLMQKELSTLFNQVYLSNPNSLRMLADLKKKFPECESDGLFHYLKGYCLANQYSMRREALVCFNRAIELENDEVLYYYDRWLAHVSLGNIEASASDKEKIYELDPTGYYLPKTIEELTKEIELNPNDSSLYVRRSNEYHEAGDMENYEKDRMTARRLYNQKYQNLK